MPTKKPKKAAGAPDPKGLGASGLPVQADGRYVQLRGLQLAPDGRRGGKGTASGSRAIDPEVDPFTQLGMYTGIGPRPLLYPPMGENSPRALVEIAAESNILEACFAAYEENIEGFGYRLVPIPTADELEADPALQAAVEAEAELVDGFFEFCWAEGSFVELRKRVRRDMETTGLGAIEVLRKRAGDVTTPIVGFAHVPGHSLRMSPPEKDLVSLTELRRAGTALVQAPVYRRFRFYCQVRRAAQVLRPVWFKEFGDPRGLNWMTGEIPGAPTPLPTTEPDPTVESLRDRVEALHETPAGPGPGAHLLGTSLAATELLVFPVKYYALSPYSIPRWLGNLPAVLGSRAAEEINLMYFDNKMIPPMMLLVSGGSLTKGTIRRLEEQLEYQAKGRENFHRVLVVEARTQDGPQATRPPKLEIRPLTEGQILDAMFMEYDVANRTKIRAAFRLPPLLTGETTDYNRATSETARQVAEEQVFRPERVRFDYTWNRRVMPAIGSRYHTFVSSGPNVTLNEDLIAALPAAEAVGAMTPNLALSILSDVLERQLPKIEEPWGDVPFTLTIATGGIPMEPEAPEAATVEELRAQLAGVNGETPTMDTLREQMESLRPTTEGLKDRIDALRNGGEDVQGLRDRLARMTPAAKARQHQAKVQQLLRVLGQKKLSRTLVSQVLRELQPTIAAEIKRRQTAAPRPTGVQTAPEPEDAEA